MKKILYLILFVLCCSIVSGTLIDEKHNLTFNGVDDYYTSAASLTNSLSQFTICSEFQGLGTIDYNLWAKNAAAARMQLSYAGGSGVGFIVNGESWMHTSENILDPTQDNVICAWYNGYYKKIYVNFQQEASQSLAGASLPSTGDMYVGHNSVNYHEIANGTMKNFYVFDTALSESEMYALFNTNSTSNQTTNQTTNTTNQTTPEQNTSVLLRYGVITDIHHTIYGDTNGVNAYSWIQSLQSSALAQNATAIVSLGDNIYERTDKTQHLNQMQSWYDMWTNTSLDTWTVFGNHDVNFATSPLVTRAEAKSAWSGALGGNDFYKINYTFVDLVFIHSSYNDQSVFSYENGVGGYYTDEELSWLNQTLAESQAAGKYVIVHTHLRADNPDANGGSINNVALRSVLEQYNGTVVALFNGDTHYNGYNFINAIHYVTFYSPVIFETPQTLNDYAIVTVYNDSLYIEGFGSQTSYNLSISHFNTTVNVTNTTENNTTNSSVTCNESIPVWLIDLYDSWSAQNLSFTDNRSAALDLSAYIAKEVY